MHRLKLESCKKITITNNITVLNGDNCIIGDDVIRTDTVGDNCRIGDDVVDTSQIDKNDTDTDVKSTHNYYALGCFVGYCILLATRILAN